MIRRALNRHFLSSTATQLKLLAVPPRPAETAENILIKTQAQNVPNNPENAVLPKKTLFQSLESTSMADRLEAVLSEAEECSQRFSAY